MPIDDPNAKHRMMTGFYARALRQANARLRDAEEDDDYDGALAAMRDIAAARAEHDALQKYADEYSRPAQSPYPIADDGTVLTPAAAMKVCGLDPNNPADVQTYMSNAQKLADLKAKGNYDEKNGGGYRNR
jgi:hypothetical protein